MTKSILAAPLLLLLATSAPAQDLPMASPIAAPIVSAVPDPQDVAWPGGAIALEIDATDVARGAYRVIQTIPLAPGTRRITLLYPQWLPGNHAPRGPLAELVDLRLSVAGKPVAWRRDPVEVNAFHVDLPEGARLLEARFIHTSPLQTTEGRVTMTREILNLQWEKMSLYPAGHYVRRIRVQPAVTFPQGWTVASALDGAATAGSRTTWAETDYETLVDSPVFAGLHARRWDLGSKVTLSAFADSPELLNARADRIARLAAMVDEALILFGKPPFGRYEYLVALSDRLGGIGLEHLASSENQIEPRNFIDWDAYDWDRNVLPHELVHSWNGKFRRPAALWTPDYRQPMQGNLLWLYEGQTQFWGHVLAARSGVQAREVVLGMFAAQAGAYAEQPGRQWRSVADTTQDPVIAARKPKPWATLARGEDYYNEAALIWLEADQLIRAGTRGQKGLDDFARAFFAHPGGDLRARTYTFADIVAGLNAVHPYDWSGFLKDRFEQPGRPAPLAGIERGGYRLTWKEEPNPYDKSRMANLGRLDLTHSLGLTLDREGDVVAAQWGGPAFNAAIVSGMRVIAVDGLAYSPDRIKAAISRAKGGDRPIEMLVRRDDRFATVAVPWAGGLRWPWLERTAPGSTPAPLDRLLAPRRAASAK